MRLLCDHDCFDSCSRYFCHGQKTIEFKYLPPQSEQTDRFWQTSVSVRQIATFSASNLIEICLSFTVRPGFSRRGAGFDRTIINELLLYQILDGILRYSVSVSLCDGFPVLSHRSQIALSHCSLVLMAFS